MGLCDGLRRRGKGNQRGRLGEGDLWPGRRGRCDLGDCGRVARTVMPCVLVSQAVNHRTQEGGLPFSARHSSDCRGTGKGRQRNTGRRRAKQCCFWPNKMSEGGCGCLHTFDAALDVPVRAGWCLFGEGEDEEDAGEFPCIYTFAENRHAITIRIKTVGDRGGE